MSTDKNKENRRIKSQLLFVFSVIQGFQCAYAELKPIGDDEMSNVSGQAFYSVDQYDFDARHYLRLSLGYDIETQFNTDEIKLGEYHRWENGDPCSTCTGTEPGLEQQPADIWIENFSLGTVAETSGIQMDGKHYEAGEIVPFYFKDPFLEIAKENNELIGVRVGFAESRGILSGNILSMTGNIEVQIEDTAESLRDAPGAPLWLRLGGAILGQTPISSQAELLTAPTNDDYNTGGIPDPVRATWIGMPAGSDFHIDIWPGYDIATTGCNLFGIATCFPLTQYQSLNVGQKQADNTYLPTDGLFISFQSKSVNWKDLETNNVTNTTPGSFLNIPTGGLELTLDEALLGLPRQRTEYIDRGNGLF